jgi:hypothetical protein
MEGLHRVYDALGLLIAEPGFSQPRSMFRKPIPLVNEAG